MKYNLNHGIPIITARYGRVILYHTYFILEETDDVYLYSEAPIGMVRAIWDAEWPYRQLRDRILAKTVGFDFFKAFKREYIRHNC